MWSEKDVTELVLQQELNILGITLNGRSWYNLVAFEIETTFFASLKFSFIYNQYI